MVMVFTHKPPSITCILLLPAIVWAVLNLASEVASSLKSSSVWSISILQFLNLPFLFFSGRKEEVVPWFTVGTLYTLQSCHGLSGKRITQS